ncbi:hypothetical protein [Granulicoccus sp. GXG6511]|uniref:hypothetical protein n=1 Tax=Granulicoccus sp. GXG6511 TaxID=3381351 RepID=UPI003D7EB24D
MSRISLGLAAAALLVVSACGNSPDTTAPQETPPAPIVTSPAATPTPAETASATATPTATPDGTATPAATASPDGTATASPTATAEAARELPASVEGFNRVNQRTEDGVRIGTYRSNDLGAVVEIRLARGASAREMITELGGTNPTEVGSATCSTQGDTICAQEQDGLTAVVSSKQLPAGIVSQLTTQVLEAD